MLQKEIISESQEPLGLMPIKLGSNEPAAQVMLKPHKSNK